jgi:predicted nucleic acid-binding protein
VLRYLIDTSALARYDRAPIKSILDSRIARGLVGIGAVTTLEVGYSSRSLDDHDRSSRLLTRLTPVLITPRAERRAVEIQRSLVSAGSHRGVSVADLLVAAIADVERLTVLHYDADFELIASITGQPTEWVVPRGSVD